MFDRFMNWLMTLLMGVVIGVALCCYVYYTSAIKVETQDTIYMANGIAYNKHNPLASKYFSPSLPWSKERPAR